MIDSIRLHWLINKTSRAVSWKIPYFWIPPGALHAKFAFVDTKNNVWTIGHLLFIQFLLFPWFLVLNYWLKRQRNSVSRAWGCRVVILLVVVIETSHRKTPVLQFHLKEIFSRVFNLLPRDVENNIIVRLVAVPECFFQACTGVIPRRRTGRAIAPVPRFSSDTIEVLTISQSRILNKHSQLN